MHLVHVAIILAIGNFVAWIVALYVKDAVSGLIGHVIASTIGGFIGGYLGLIFIPQLGVVGLMLGGFIGSGLLLYLVRFKKWGGHKKDA